MYKIYSSTNFWHQSIRVKKRGGGATTYSIAQTKKSTCYVDQVTEWLRQWTGKNLHDVPGSLLTLILPTHSFGKPCLFRLQNTAAKCHPCPNHRHLLLGKPWWSEGDRCFTLPPSQSIFQIAARLIFWNNKSLHATLLNKTLLWFHITLRRKSKFFTSKALRHQSPLLVSKVMKNE